MAERNTALPPGCAAGIAGRSRMGPTSAMTRGDNETPGGRSGGDRRIRRRRHRRQAAAHRFQVPRPDLRLPRAPEGRRLLSRVGRAGGHLRPVEPRDRAQESVLCGPLCLVQRCFPASTLTRCILPAPRFEFERRARNEKAAKSDGGEPPGRNRKRGYWMPDTSIITFTPGEVSAY